MFVAKNTDPKKRIFNLLKPYKPPPTSWDRIYDWLLGKARLVMVIAEIAVALAFIGKVVVDVQAKALDDQIKTKDFELQQFASAIEPNIRTIQQKSQTYSKTWDSASAYSDVLKEIDSYIPNTGSDLNIHFSGSTVTIRGDDTLGTLSLIEKSMRASKTFSAVSVPSLSSDNSAVQKDSGVLVLNATIAKVANRTQI